MEFFEINHLTTEAKENLLKERYGHKVGFVGKKHPVVDKIIAVNNNSKANPERLAILSGIWALTLAQKYEVPMKYLIICPAQLKTIESQRLIDYFIDRSEKTFIVSERVFATLAETENGQGLLAAVHLDYTPIEELVHKDQNILLILDGLEIPGNVGTILRSAEATAIDGVILTNRKVRLNHPKLLRSSMGSVFKVPVVQALDTKELISNLKKKGYRILLADTHGAVKYFEEDYQGRIALVMGSEKYGISEDFYDEEAKAVMIPMLGDMDSLNVGVATTILLYEAAMKNKGIMNR